MSDAKLPTPEEAREALANIDYLEVRRRRERDRLFSSVSRHPERENKSTMDIISWDGQSFIVSVTCEFGSLGHRMSRKNAYELVERLSARLKETATDEVAKP